MGQTEALEGTVEDQELGNLLDRTPTPTSLEVREQSMLVLIQMD